MQLRYSSKKLEKRLTDPTELLRSYGQLARKVNQRLKELGDADNLAVMRTLPAAVCKELTGDRKGELSVRVSENYRLIFTPDHEPRPGKANGGLDWEAVTRIVIQGIEDYH